MKSKATIAQIDFRKQLLARGFFPILTHAKKPGRTGWNLPGSHADMSEWPANPDAGTRSAGTGVKVVDGLLVIDLDVKSEQAAKRLLRVIWKKFPQFMQKALQRTSGACSIALFGRTKVGQRAMRSAKYQDGELVHAIEIYAGGPEAERCKRHFTVYGPHSEGREYSFLGDSLVDRELLDLPYLSREEVDELGALLESELDSHYARLANSFPGESGDQTQVYDLTPEMTFKDEHDHVWPLQELERSLQESPREIRGYAPWDPASLTRDRCKAGVGHSGLWIVDFKLVETHRWVEAKPAGDLDDLAAAMAELEQTEQVENASGNSGPQFPLDEQPAEDSAPQSSAPPPVTAPPPKPPKGAAPVAYIAWLKQAYVFDTINDRARPRYATSALDVYSDKAHAVEHPWLVPSTTPTGRPTQALATKLWRTVADTVRGVALRPDMPWPLYADESGRQVKNLYLRPHHPAQGGDVEPFMRFLTHLLPIARERQWCFDWLTHKWMNPHIPGVGVVMVAHNVFGAGRGRFFEILRKLHGENYCRSQDFAMLSGSSSQASYTAWLADAVLVLINEAAQSPTAHRQGERNAVYEMLKRAIDPGQRTMTVQQKYQAERDAQIFASIVIATNHRDAIQIPADDRRLVVLSNGPALSRSQAIEISGWMEQPANIAALARALERHAASGGLRGFDAYTPPTTVAKGDMAELSRNEIDERMAEMAADDALGLVFSRAQLQARFEAEFSASMGRDWQWRFDKAWRGMVTRAMAGEAQRAIQANGRRIKLFCFDARKAAAESLPPEAARAHWERWNGGVALHLADLESGDTSEETPPEER